MEGEYLHISGNESGNGANNTRDSLMNSSHLTVDIEGNNGTHSLTTVLIIGSLFMLVTLGFISALVAFVRKRNTVFVFQKSEQEDYEDCEMDELNTDIEYADTDVERDLEAQINRSKRRKKHIKPRHIRNNIVSVNMMKREERACSNVTSSAEGYQVQSNRGQAETPQGSEKDAWNLQCSCTPQAEDDQLAQSHRLDSHFDESGCIKDLVLLSSGCHARKNYVTPLEAVYPLRYYCVDNGNIADATISLPHNKSTEYVHVDQYYSLKHKRSASFVTDRCDHVGMYLTSQSMCNLTKGT